MGKYSKEIVKLSAQEILLSIFDLATPFFEASSIYRISTRQYLEQRAIDKSQFKERIKYLKRAGLIDSFVENKESFFELTNKGVAKVNRILDLHPVIERPEKWDKKWRMVIFDVPEKRKNSRDLFRLKLVEMGFELVQDSVYVHPFECTEAITKQSEMLLIENNVLISISEIIQGENILIQKFLDKKVLEESDLK